MSLFAGIGQQVKLVLRLDRLSLLVWPLALAGLLAAMADSMASLYPDQAARDIYAALNEASPVIQAINGPGHALETPGGIVVFEVGGYLLLATAIMSALLVVRRTRNDEEQGRAELTLSTASGRLAGLAAALLLAGLASLLVGGTALVALLALDLPFGGSVMYAAGLVSVGLVYAAIAAIAAQLTTQASAAMGLAGLAVAAGYGMRAAGDVTDSDLSWASPFGWVQAMAPFDRTQQWWPLGLALAVAVALMLVALGIRSRRELDQGLIPPRPGPAVAGPLLRGSVSATLLATARSAVAWGVALIGLALAFGAAGEEVIEVFEASEGLGALLGMDESGALDAYFTLVITLLALLTAGFGIAAIIRLRSEEASGLAELILSTATGRIRWFGATVLAAALGTGVLLVLAGTALGLSFAVVSDDWTELGRLLLATMMQLPAVWLLVVLAAVLVGWFPRLGLVAWAALAGCAVLDLLGGPLQLENEVLDLSPFAHVPQLPVDEIGTAPWVLAGIAVVLTAVAHRGIVVRDLRS